MIKESLACLFRRITSDRHRVRAAKARKKVTGTRRSRTHSLCLGERSQYTKEMTRIGKKMKGHRAFIKAEREGIISASHRTFKIQCPLPEFGPKKTGPLLEIGIGRDNAEEFTLLHLCSNDFQNKGNQENGQCHRMCRKDGCAEGVDNLGHI